MHNHQVTTPSSSHAGHHAHMVEDFRRRFWISLALTLPILALSADFWHLFGRSPLLSFTGDHLLLSALSTVVYFYGGWPFLKGLVEVGVKASADALRLSRPTADCAIFAPQSTVQRDRKQIPEIQNTPAGDKPTSPHTADKTPHIISIKNMGLSHRPVRIPSARMKYFDNLFAL